MREYRGPTKRQSHNCHKGAVCIHSRGIKRCNRSGTSQQAGGHADMERQAALLTLINTSKQPSARLRSSTLHPSTVTGCKRTWLHVNCIIAHVFVYIDTLAQLYHLRLQCSFTALWCECGSCSYCGMPAGCVRCAGPCAPTCLFVKTAQD